MDNLTIRIGIMSTAEIAHKVYLAIKDAHNAEVTAVASRDLERAQKWGNERNIPKAYGQYQELLDDKDIDAIYIPLPTAFKKEWTIKSFEAGKHVLVEKPLPGLEDDVDLKEMIEAAKKSGKQFLDGTMWLHSTRTKELRKTLADGGIG
jgi:xylose dehydrogenase (NAD/NADP)